MNVKDFYKKNYPTDEWAISELDPNATFLGVLDALYRGVSVYDYLGVSDSIVRERVFSELSDIMKVDYEYVYNIWLYTKASV